MFDAGVVFRDTSLQRTLTRKERSAQR